MYFYRLHHPNIVELLEVHEEKTKVYLVMELWVNKMFNKIIIWTPEPVQNLIILSAYFCILLDYAASFMPVIHIIYHYLYLHYIFFLVFFYYLFFIFWLNFFFIIPSSYSVLKVVLATHMFASFSVWSVLFLAQLKHFEFPAICLSVNIYKKNRAVVRFSHLGVLIVIDCSLLPLSSFLKP